MQKQTEKMKSTWKSQLGKENLDWKSQPWKKVNGSVKINGQIWKVNGQTPIVKGWCQRLTQASDVNNDTTRANVDDVSERVEARESAWPEVAARGGAWEKTQMCNGAWKAHDQRNRTFEQRVQSSMALRVPQVCRSAQDNLSGTFTNVIGAIFATVMQMAMVYEMWNSLTAAASPNPKDDGWMMSKVQQQEAAAAVVMAKVMLKRESY